MSNIQFNVIYSERKEHLGQHLGESWLADLDIFLSHATNQTDAIAAVLCTNKKLENATRIQVGDVSVEADSKTVLFKITVTYSAFDRMLGEGVGRK